MEFQPITPPPTLFPNAAPPGRSHKKILIIGGAALFLLLIISVLIMLISKGPSGNPATKITLFDIPFLKQIVTGGAEPFMEKSLPRPIKDLTIGDIPELYEASAVAQAGTHLFIASHGHIIEYDAVQRAVVAATNTKKTGSCTDVAVTAGHIYAACNVAGIAQYKDSFVGHEKESERFVIVKANPETLITEQVFTPKDGLKSTEGYRLTSAADAVWISTQNGVGRIDTKTNAVTFADRELGIKSPQVSTGTVLFDGNHVWVQIVANAQSMGGIALFNKTTGKWTGFDSDNLQDRVIGKVDLEGIKLVPGGIQIAFRDGRVNQTERLVEKEYQYESGIWKKLSDKPTTGDGGIPTYEYMRTAYPQPPVFTLPSANGLTIMRNPVTGQSYGTNGRRSYILSPMIGDKRYLLTSATIDIIQDSSPFNKILIPLGEGIGLEQSFANVAQYQQTIQFAIDPASLIGLVTDSACGPTGCTDRQKAWLVDLKSEQLLRVYTSADLLPGGKILTGLHIIKKGNAVEVYNKLGLRVFTIDLSDYHLTPLSTIKPAP